MELRNIFNDLEMAALQRFLSDPVLMEAVRKGLLFPAYYPGTLLPGESADPMKNFAFNFVNGYTGTEERTDEQIARQLRVAKDAVLLLEGAFKDLLKLKTSETITLPKENKAR